MMTKFDLGAFFFLRHLLFRHSTIGLMQQNLNKPSVFPSLNQLQGTQVESVPE